MADLLKQLLLSRGRTDRFSLEEFYNRVKARGDVGYPQAVDESRAVFAVLQEAVTRGEIEDILSELPAEYRELFGGQPRSPLSPTEL